MPFFHDQIPFFTTKFLPYLISLMLSLLSFPCDLFNPFQLQCLVFHLVHFSCLLHIFWLIFLSCPFFHPFLFFLSCLFFLVCFFPCLLLYPCWLLFNPRRIESIFPTSFLFKASTYIRFPYSTVASIAVLLFLTFQYFSPFFHCLFRDASFPPCAI